MNPDRKWILIVDDDEKLAILLRKSLQTMGEDYDVVTATGTDEALAKVSKRSFDLVITDLMMPEVDGLQLLEALRAIDPSIVTVAMTAFDSREVKAKAKSLGIYRYLSKPFSVHEFRQCVIDVFKGAERANALAFQGPDDKCATILMLEFQVSLWRDAPALAAALEQLNSLTSGIIHDLRNSLGLIWFLLHEQQVMTAETDFCFHLLESMAALRFKSQASYDFHQGEFESPELSRTILNALHGGEAKILLLVPWREERITGLTIHGWLDEKWLYQGVWTLLWSLASRLSPGGKIEVKDRRFDDEGTGFHITIATPSNPNCIQEEALQPEAVLSGDEVALGLFLMRKAVAFHKGQLTVQPGLIEIYIPTNFWEELPPKGKLQREIDRMEEEIAVRERSQEGIDSDITPLVRSFALPLLRQLDIIQAEMESLAREGQNRRPWVTILRSCRYSRLLLWNLLWLGVGLEPPQEAVDVEETLHLVLGTLDSQIRHDEIKVVTNVDKDLPPALADELGLRQVFMNVILNALEAMPEEGCLTLRARQESDRVVVEIADTGHGIPPENLDKIYDIRFSTKGGRERGIGLYVVKSVVDRLGGQLEVVSRVGEGTTFTVRLPVASV